MKKQILIGIGILTIGLSVLAGLTVAKPPAKQQPMVLLGNFYGTFECDSADGWDVIMDTMIRTDKPAKFTVTAGVEGHDDPTVDSVTFYMEQRKTEYSITWYGKDIYSEENNHELFSYLGYGAYIAYDNQNEPWLRIWWRIMVEGEEDTVVYFDPPF